jgi:biopolymer transport protein ExbB/TolQ
MNFTLAGIWAQMGLFARFIVVVMGIMSVLALVIAGDRLVLFNKARNEARSFAAKMGALLAKGDLDAAASAKLGKDIGDLGRVITAGLTAYATTAKVASKDLIFESVARALERQAQREAATMKRGLGILATISATAPFVGLLGTVMGIITAFQTMAATGSGGLGTVAGGIAEALATTAFGLLVAIPAVMLFNYFQGRVDGRAVDISESSNEFLDVVARELASKEAASAEAAE